MRPWPLPERVLMQLVFVRHALPVRADAGADGIADPALSSLGERQSEPLVNALRGQPFPEVTCSPAVRAVGTAGPFLQDRRLQPRIEPGLLEYSRPDRAYLPLHELRLEGGAEWEQIALGELPAFVGGAAFQQRIVAAVEDIVAHHPGRQSVLIVLSRRCHQSLPGPRAWDRARTGLSHRLCVDQPGLGRSRRPTNRAHGQRDPARPGSAGLS